MAKRRYRKKNPKPEFLLAFLLLFVVVAALTRNQVPDPNLLITSVFSIAAFGLVFLVVAVGYVALKQVKVLRALQSLEMEQVDAMHHADFELYVCKLLQHQGFTSVKRVGGSNDGGADIIAKKDGENYAIQVKHYARSVNLRAVQEAVTAMELRGYQHSMVVTNAVFTRPTLSHTKGAERLTLIDRDHLAMWVHDFRVFNKG